MGSVHRMQAFCALVLALVFVPQAAFAVLGGDADSVEADRVRLRAAASVRHAPRYALHEIADPAGMKVREYVSPAGKVFAVAWEGPALPDLRQLLGAHFERYAASASPKRFPRMPIVIRAPDLVVVTGGHLRAFRGRAYVPALVPGGVEVETLR